jgi:hypothetical protein
MEEKLNELIERLKWVGTFKDDKTMKPQISDQMLGDLLDYLKEIREESKAQHNTPKDCGHTPASKYANHVGVPLEFNDWVLEKFDIVSEPNEVPRLNATYIRL